MSNGVSAAALSSFLAWLSARRGTFTSADVFEGWKVSFRLACIDVYLVLDIVAVAVHCMHACGVLVG